MASEKIPILLLAILSSMYHGDQFIQLMPASSRTNENFYLPFHSYLRGLGFEELGSLRSRNGKHKWHAQLLVLEEEFESPKYMV